MTAPAPAPDLIARFAVHGGRVDQARAWFPQVAAWTDLSTGIAPWAYPVAEPGEAPAPLPDPARLAELEARAAHAFGTVPDHVVAVPGSDLALRLIGAILPGPAGWVTPGYAGHRAMWPQDRAVALSRADFADVAGEHRHIVLARPNNPDGWCADANALAGVATRLATKGGWLIVDEAFADATPDDSVAGRGWPGLIVLRSFGKFYGLAGLRLGFVIAPPAIAGPLRAMLGDWPISTPALAAGIAAYGDTAWQSGQRQRLSEVSERMAAQVAAAGLDIVGRTAFFTLVALPRRDALFAHLARAGVLTRPFAAQPTWLRLGLPGDMAGWQRVRDALASWSNDR